MQILPHNTSIVNVADSVNGNPTLMYSAFIMVECHEYMSMMRETPNEKVKNIDAGTAALIAMYPHRDVKERLFAMYEKEKEKDGAVTASIRTISEMMSCLSDAMEWTQKSYAGF